MHLEEYRHCREEERYEVGIASGRLASLLASQAFLFTAWAIIHGPSGRQSPRLILIVLPCIALTICVTAFVAIGAAVVVIRRWQRHGYQLIAEDRNSPEPQLTNFHIGRSPNDWFHITGVDLFSLAVPGLFALLWMILLIYSILLDGGNAS